MARGRVVRVMSISLSLSINLYQSISINQSLSINLYHLNRQLRVHGNMLPLPLSTNHQYLTTTIMTEMCHEPAIFCAREVLLMNGLTSPRLYSALSLSLSLSSRSEAAWCILDYRGVP